MKTFFFLIITILTFLISCARKPEDYRPDSCLSKERQMRLLAQVVRYANKLAPEATNATKFDVAFNWYYDRAVAESRILYCSPGDSMFQLLMVKKARSITPMEEGIALKIKLNENDSITYYEEVFRMWKMPSDTLRNRGKFLFNRMVNKEDLSIYYSTFQKDRFIEFPNERFSFDVEKRRWRDQELDSIRFN
jgi:hypothetical protein